MVSMCFAGGEKQFFEENGYLWVKGFFSGDQVQMLQEWATDMHNEALNQLAGEDSNDLIVVPESKDPKKVCRVEDMLSIYPEFQAFVEELITPYIDDLIGEATVTFKDKLNFKWPGGGAFMPHQDYPAFAFFTPKEHINAMICVDPANLENGCLQIAKSWKQTFSENEEVDQQALDRGMAILPYIEGGSEHGAIKPPFVKKITWIPLEAQAGDLVLFTSYVPHFSETNTSNCSRRAMFLTYNKLADGEHRVNYYLKKRSDPSNPIFHFGTPTKARGK
ncbi:MAG: 2-aminoethylphosphonate dioxygenase [Chlamydiia bacterium]|nr:2-aminoethylphosphonate dioxygenase [Chlamydiia bacterium]MCH9615257.1 2-aminoethylphosphonate dioxygenase [Chlamydiia bacterium]MCH9628421.1 2-aminoethylphosphonate dioxygenase [Chlamydiia bacterium]